MLTVVNGRLCQKKNVVSDSEAVQSTVLSLTSLGQVLNALTLSHAN